MNPYPTEIKLIPCWFIIIMINQFNLIPLKEDEIIYIQLFFLLTIGFFHGAYDLHYAQMIATKKKLTMFITQYIFQALCFCTFWLIFPNLGLVLFFITACIHFGLDWDDSHLVNQAIFGYGILALSFYAHPDTTHQLFANYFPTLAPHLLLTVTSMAPLAFILGLCKHLINKDYIKFSAWASFQMLGLYCHPLTFFIIYFCGFHSLRHIHQMRKKLINTSRSDLTACFIWMASLILLLCTYQILKIKINAFPLETCFIFLAGLTIPHMWLHLPNLSKTK